MAQVYPPTEVSATTLSGAPPPPYQPGIGYGVQPVQVEMQPVILQPTVVQPVLVSIQTKMTDQVNPYLEFCPRCRTTVTTRTQKQLGACWWTIFVVGCFVCWPIWFWLCCTSSKDVRHYCPNCASILAVKKGGC